MRYRLQPGVVLATVCGESMLIATRKARGLCPYTKQLNPTGAYFWTLLEQGMELEEMVSAAAARFGQTPERIRPGLARFLQTLEQLHYLTGEETP